MSATITAHLRVNDTATGRPTPVRLAVTGPDGSPYAPLGRLAEFAGGRGEDVGGHLRAGRDRWCYIDGACEIRLPTGVPLRVRATKGPEYDSLDRTVTLGAGQMALRFEVRRWSKLADAGWVGGDTRVHYLSPHAALLEAAAEDVAVVNLLAHQTAHLAQDGKTYAAVPNMTAFSGQTPALETDGRAVVVNTFNTHPALGRVGLLYCHRAVFPLAFGEPDGPDDWAVSDWCDQCHRKNGLAVWADAFRPEAGLVGGEALVAAVLGKIDAIEFDPRPRPQPLVPWYYRLLNAGVRLPLVGGSGKDSNRTAVGAARTYARIAPGRPPDYAAWVEAVRGGRTFATTGPLLELSVNGERPGAEVEASVAGTVRVAARAESGVPFDRLEVVADGRVVATAVPAEGRRATAAVAVEHPISESCWVAARCSGVAGFAHTSPVRVVACGRPLPRRAEAVGPLRAAVAQTREWAVTRGRYADDKWRRQLLDRCDAALAVLVPTEPTP